MRLYFTSEPPHELKIGTKQYSVIRTPIYNSMHQESLTFVFCALAALWCPGMPWDALCCPEQLEITFDGQIKIDINFELIISTFITDQDVSKYLFNSLKSVQGAPEHPRAAKAHMVFPDVGTLLPFIADAHPLVKGMFLLMLLS